MRIRSWIFAALVALIMCANLALVSLRIGQTGEDSVRARVALAVAALRGQLELLDARQSPRAVSTVPELIEATRAPADSNVAPGKPDERALRAAASALQPEPDLVAVATPQGAIVSRRSMPAKVLDDPAALPLAKAALEGNPAPAFAQFDGGTWRISAARVPGNTAVAVVATLVDDRLAALLRSQVDADVTLIQNGKVLASSLPPGDERVRLLKWAASPGPGYGTLPVRLPLIDYGLSGELPWGTSRIAVRGALFPIDSGVQAAVTVPQSPYLSWLARYQAFYALGLVLFVVFAFFWGLLARAPKPVAGPAQQPADLVGADVSDAAASPAKRPARDVPWSPGEGPSGEFRVPKLDSNPRLRPVPKASAAPAEDAEADETAEAVDGEPAEGGTPELKPPSPPAPFHDSEPAWAGEASPSSFDSLDSAMPAPGSGSEAADEWAAAVPPAPDAQPPEEREESLPEQEEPLPEAPPEERKELSFAGLLEDSGGQPPARAQPPAATPSPSAAPPKEVFPGDEPTRVEPVSAALLDKLREKDEEAAKRRGEPKQQASEPSETPQDEEDPDLPHWQETFDKFQALKQQLGESSAGLTFERFSAKLRKNREDLIARHNARGVRFAVYEKDGKAAIKASAIR